MQKDYIEVFQTMGMINIFILLVGSSLFYTALIIPIILKFGCIKMRVVMIVIYAVLFGISSVIMNIIKDVMIVPSKMTDALTTIQGSPTISIGVLGIILMGYIASYFISVRIMETKAIGE